MIGAIGGAAGALKRRGAAGLDVLRALEIQRPVAAVEGRPVRQSQVVLDHDRRVAHRRAHAQHRVGHVADSHIIQRCIIYRQRTGVTADQRAPLEGAIEEPRPAGRESDVEHAAGKVKRAIEVEGTATLAEQRR